MNDSTSRPSFIPERWKDRTGAFYSFKAAWWYRNPAGEPQGVVARFDGPQGKQVVPYFKPDGRGGFKTGGPPAPVLFGAERLNGRAAPAFVVEGEKCAAALHSLGLAAVSAQGGANKAAGGDWPALAGVPQVYLLPDNDLPGEGYARAACKALARLTPPPEVRLIRLPVPEKGDAADWLAACVPGWNGLDPLPQERRADLAQELLALAERSEPPPADWLADDAKPERAHGKPANAGGGRYVATPTGIKAVKWNAQGEPEEMPLCNFTARIVAETTEDDGAETKLLLTVEGEQGGRPLPRVPVTFEEFMAMGWPAKNWGTHCIVEPGNGKKDTLRAAIQTLSHAAGTVERRTVYTHTGWRKVDGAWLYLHGAGAMGAAGPVAGIDVELKDLARYALPAPSTTPKERREAAAASLACLDLAPHAASLPLLACVYLAPLAQALNVDFMLWLEAPSQSQKSSIAAVALAHFGAAMDRTCLTANWTDSANALEGKLFTLADTLAVIDDYAPQPSQQAQHQLDATASRVIRGCGNRQGRGRLRADLSQRPERFPRGLVIGTAEQWPIGESVNARLFGATLKRGDVDLAALTRGQAAAAGGLLARAMADFIQDLAARFDATVADCKQAWASYRATALQHGLSGRAPEQVAFLLTGAQLAFGHFRRAGLTLPDLSVVDILLDLARRHARHVSDSQPAERFRLALAELLAGGAAHVEPLANDGSREAPPEPLHGPCLGWRNDAKGELYLLATPTLEAVNSALTKGDTGLNIRPRALWRQCQQRGWLQPGNPTGAGQETTRTVKIAGKSERVLVFDANALES
ncbi:MAG: hypothetical protein RKR03_03475 [Candidatus Competibacter sp.]|nr:hypothetical protein [Candidatus Competibacter sp.]